MDGIQLIRLLDLLNVSGLSEAVGVSPRSIYIDGEDFRSVESVLINGMEAPEFVVLSERRLIAEVPEPLRQTTITEVSVFSQNLTFTERSLVTFTFGTRPKKARGAVRLMQTFLRILLRTPGSNIFHRRSGGGMLRRVGGVINNRSAADIQIAVTAAKQYIIASQTPVRELPSTERLLEAEITSLVADPANTSIYVTIALTSHSRERVAATLLT